MVSAARGDYRILYRPLVARESAGASYLVARVVHRSELDWASERSRSRPDACISGPLSCLVAARYRPDESLDLKALKPPWLRLRVGDYRILYRPVGADESFDAAYLVARVTHRRELERAVASLD